MKKILLFLLLFITINSFSQDYEKSWLKVYEFEYAGKIKDASLEVNKIYKKAKKNNNQPEIIKTFFYQSKFSQTLEEEAQYKIIENLKKEIQTSDITSKAIFYNLHATLLYEYYHKIRYNLYDKTVTDSIYSPDFRTWSSKKFETEIVNLYQKSLENEEILINTPLSEYEKIIYLNKYEKTLNLSLYDFLVDQYLEKIDNLTEEAKTENQDTNNSIKDLYGETNIFQKLNLSNFPKNSFYKKLSFYQKLEKNYASKNNNLALSYIILKRLKAVSEMYKEYSRYLVALENAYNSSDRNYKNAYLLEIATAYRENASKEKNADFNKKAIEIIEKIISKKNEPFSLEANNLKKKILQKKINVTTEKYLLPNQKNRALVNFTNVDSIFGTIYRVPNDFDFNSSYTRYYSKKAKKHVNLDSLYIDYAQKHKPYKSFESVLPNKLDYFEYSTEIVFPELETGTYLLILNIENQKTISDESVCAYAIITATELTLSSADIGKSREFMVLNRKTGKPIENAILKIENFSVKTNKDGKAIINIANDAEKMLVISKNDTLLHSYWYNNYSNYHKKQDKWNAKVNFFTDRSIYRPGQKIYFKGIFTQEKEGKLSTVPNLYVNVIVEDANSKEVFETRLKSNEFGSFTGEFVIPKNSLTGTFRIFAEEDEEYENDLVYDKKKQEHPFWDNIDDFEEESLYFSVEEYKRPKFEIRFDPIKDNFIVNQDIKIKGNANAFSGSKITDAKVSYTVTRQTHYSTNWYRSKPNYSYDNTQIKNGETKTDENGNFEMDFNAIPSEEFDEKGLPVFTYLVQTSITDNNGETQSKSKEVKVGFHSLELTATIASKINAKKTEKIKIDSKNLNGEFAEAQGEIKIYKLKSPNRILRNRSWSLPEIQTISEKEFQKWFPAEPYTNEDDINNWEKGDLVFSKTVNTKTDKTVSLSDLKNWISGEYKLFFNAKDSFGKDIEAISNFNLAKQEDKKLADNQLLQFNVLNENPRKDGFIELQYASATPELYILTDAFYKNETIFSKVIDLKNGKKTIKIPIDKKAIGEVTLMMNFVWENQKFSNRTSVYLREDNSTLSIHLSHLRNKIEPGSNETWSFSIKDQNKKESIAETLATMYDASLDEFKKSNWNTNLKFNENYYNNESTRNFLSFGNSYFQFNNLYREHISHYSEETKLKSFGFNFAYPNSNNSKYRKFLVEMLALQKGLEVSGYVTDRRGLPLPGVNVFVSGTQRATVTNLDGYYKIKALIGEVLEFNSLGMEDHFGFVNGDPININMDEKALPKEVIVIAYGTQKRQAIVGSLSVIVDEEDTISLNNNGKLDDSDGDGVFDEVLNKIQGYVSGVNIVTAGGIPGNSANFSIRGISSVDLSEEILYIIDGSPITAKDFEKINVTDIQNITVLKDGAATALYGYRASNGVVIITTKNAISELSKVQTRKNFNETAFFFPQIQADKDGKISFNFTSPEALTQWKLRLFAHDKKANSGYFEHKVITQKDFMITPNLPRFLREKDSITITTKISNLTSEAKSGIAMLQLFDAVSMESIDAQMLNLENTKVFQVKEKGNTAVSWKIYVPEGLQGVQYKIVAKAGNFSDGEENILPVLTNNMLVTESIPVWVRENSTKEYTFENLKNNTSTTLRNQQLTLEYTSNPTWLAIQSLPYLMEYEHECAEQTFARYYANALASEIINSNPKIAEVFESWKKSEKPLSKLEQNEELKLVLLAETPWITDALSEEEKKKNLATLFDLQKMKDSQKAILEKLTKKQKASGGFSWFDDGNESEYITRHIISGLGHLQKLSKNVAGDFDEITKKGVGYLDQKFLENHTISEANNKSQKLIWIYPYNNLHYLYARSFYLEKYPITENISSITKKYTANIKENWLNYSLYEKGLASLVLSRFGEKETAKKILENLRQTSSNNEDWGMYWIENKSGWYWYQAPIETQALLIEAFAEIENDKKSVDAMKVWLLKNKQNKNWPTTKATTEAVYALLMQGTDWISVKDKTVIKIGSEKTVTNKLAENEKEAGTGYIKMSWKSDEITKEMATVSVNNKSVVPGFGGFYWQYFEDLDKIKSSQESPMTIEKELYLKANTSEGNQLQRITSEKSLKIGDLVTVRLVISTKEDMEFVHLKDMRASCFEPIDVLSKYKWQDRLGYYQSTKDVATHFFFDRINKGKYVLEYDIRVNNLGDFSNGITTIQSMYAPEFSSHTKGIRVKIK